MAKVWFDESRCNKQLTGGKNVCTNIRWTKRCDPLNKTVESYEDRGGQGYVCTFDDGKIYMGKSTQHYYGGGNAKLVSGANEETTIRYNGYNKITIGGEFNTTTGTQVSSAGGVGSKRYAEYIVNSSKGGGSHNYAKMDQLCRETMKLASSGARADFVGGAYAQMINGTHGVISKSLNYASDAIAMTTGPGPISLAAGSHLKACGAFGCEIAAGPTGGIRIAAGPGSPGTYIIPGPTHTMAPDAGVTTYVQLLQPKSGFGRINSMGGRIEQFAMIHMNPGTPITELVPYEAFMSPPAPPEYNVAMRSDPTAIG